MQVAGQLRNRTQYVAMLNALATVSIALGRVFVPPQLSCMDSDVFPHHKIELGRSVRADDHKLTMVTERSQHMQKMQLLPPEQWRNLTHKWTLAEGVDRVSWVPRRMHASYAGAREAVRLSPVAELPGI